jgi:hypothetical protein
MLLITVTVQTDELAGFAKSADDVAAEVLAAVGGDPATDRCVVTVAVSASGEAGAPPPA